MNITFAICPLFMAVTIRTFNSTVFNPTFYRQLLAHTSSHSHKGHFLTPMAPSTLAQPLNMVATVRVSLVDTVNCPKCGYNNITNTKYCAGTLSNGDTCGQELAQVV